MKQLKTLLYKAKKTAKRLYKRRVEITILAIFLVEFAFPQTVAATPIANALTNPAITVEQFVNTLPESADRAPRKTMRVTVTAYTSTVDQTDASPCITANGLNVCERDTEDIIAANFLPFGTRVKMPEYFGDRVFIVADRMNARYTNRVDVWLKDRNDAKQFGVRYLEIEIY